jgi:hypothetical protein
MGYILNGRGVYFVSCADFDIVILWVIILKMDNNGETEICEVAFQVFNCGSIGWGASHEHLLLVEFDRAFFGDIEGCVFIDMSKTSTIYWILKIVVFFYDSVYFIKFPILMEQYHFFSICIHIFLL